MEACTRATITARATKTKTKVERVNIFPFVRQDLRSAFFHVIFIGLVSTKLVDWGEMGLGGDGVGKAQRKWQKAHDRKKKKEGLYCLLFIFYLAVPPLKPHREVVHRRWSEWYCEREKKERERKRKSGTSRTTFKLPTTKWKKKEETPDPLSQLRLIIKRRPTQTGLKK